MFLSFFGSIFGTIGGWITGGIGSILGSVGMGLSFGVIVFLVVLALAPSVMGGLLGPWATQVGEKSAAVFAWLWSVVQVGFGTILSTWQTWFTVILLCAGVYFYSSHYAVKQCPAVVPCPRCTTAQVIIDTKKQQQLDQYNSEWFFQRWYHDIF